jgi:hypothetical protein
VGEWKSGQVKDFCGCGLIFPVYPLGNPLPPGGVPSLPSNPHNGK